MANLNQFRESYKLFFNYVGYYKKLSYAEWNAQPSQFKSPLLFVQFYDQICQAWNKANSYDFIPSDDGVAIVMQYLEKNVSKIEENESKFSPAYIYTVAYNCMYCICHDIKANKDRWENEIPNIATNDDGDEFDLLTTIANQQESAESSYEKLQFQADFWAAIENAGLSTEKVINYLLSDNDPKALKKVNKKSKAYELDPLRDVEVSLDAVSSIVDELRDQLSAVCAKYEV